MKYSLKTHRKKFKLLVYYFQSMTERERPQTITIEFTFEHQQTKCPKASDPFIRRTFTAIGNTQQEALVNVYIIAETSRQTCDSCGCTYMFVG